MRLHPLLLLLALRVGALPRNLVRSRSPKRIVMSLVGIGLVFLWLAPSTIGLMMARSRPNTDGFHAVAPFVLLLLTLINVFAARRGALVFSPAEVDLLFPAPFSRRALLLYRLAMGLAGHVFFGVLFSIWFGRYAAFWPGALAAAILASVFVNLTSVAAALVTLRLGAAARKRIPIFAFAAAAAFLALIAFQAAPLISADDPKGTIAAISNLPVVAALLAPLRIFVSAFAAPDAAQLLTWLSAALALDAALLLAVIFLDADYLEAAATASERAAQRVQRARRGGAWTASAPTKARGNVPDLPFLAGAGPVIWLQLTRLRRYPAALIFPAAMILVPAAVMWRIANDGGEAVVPMTGALVGMTIFTTSLLRFDFRADIDYLDRYRALPISPLAMAAGQLAVPVGLMAAVQVSLLAVGAALGPLPTPLLAAALFFAPLLSAVLLAADNLVYLLAPARMPTHGLDMQATGRQAVLGLAKLLLLALAVLPAFLAVLAVRALTDSPAAAALAAWLVLAAVGLALLSAVAAAFRRLDVSVDLPT